MISIRIYITIHTHCTKMGWNYYVWYSDYICLSADIVVLDNQDASLKVPVLLLCTDDGDCEWYNIYNTPKPWTEIAIDLGSYPDYEQHNHLKLEFGSQKWNDHILQHFAPSINKYIKIETDHYCYTHQYNDKVYYCDIDHDLLVINITCDNNTVVCIKEYGEWYKDWLKTKK